ncbi:MAG: hypothetical protein DLM63_03770 [Solirubrobacterales bacterium]|nr:MAG: hypothetical protein DLM63_03770 [Solirubrobacterales bacterium]
MLFAGARENSVAATVYALVERGAMLRPKLARELRASVLLRFARLADGRVELDGPLRIGRALLRLMSAPPTGAGKLRRLQAAAEAAAAEDAANAAADAAGPEPNVSD